jgi:NAD(P)-dependent dehydrogenase (short-subunit alcohol dehydrogenase family)
MIETTFIPFTHTLQCSSWAEPLELCFANRRAHSQQSLPLHFSLQHAHSSWAEPLDSHSEKGWDKVLTLNLKALFFTTQRALPLLLAAASDASPARVINIGSIVGERHQAVPTYGYDASKAGRWL